MPSAGSPAKSVIVQPSRRSLDDLVLSEFDGLSGELDERGDVAAEEHLALADADDERGVAPRRDDDVGLLGVEQRRA